MVISNRERVSRPKFVSRCDQVINRVVPFKISAKSRYKKGKKLEEKLKLNLRNASRVQFRGSSRRRLSLLRRDSRHQRKQTLFSSSSDRVSDLTRQMKHLPRNCNSFPNMHSATHTSFMTWSLPRIQFQTLLVFPVRQARNSRASLVSSHYPNYKG